MIMIALEKNLNGRVIARWRDQTTTADTCREALEALGVLLDKSRVAVLEAANRSGEER